MQLTKNFLLEEFTRSATATRHGHVLEPCEGHIFNLSRLAKDVLQPLREAVGCRVRITSGYRDKWLNTRVGGSIISAHMDGRAADIQCSCYTPRELIEILDSSNVPYDKAILEFGRWVHIQVPKIGRKPRHDIYTATNDGNGTEYIKGIV